MRFLVLALSVAVTACAALPYHEPPRPIVVLVHGRGQLGQDTAMLRRGWARDMDASLKAAGLPALRGDDVRLAWYADVLDPESESGCETRASSSDSMEFGDLARGFLSLITSAVPKEESRDVRGFMGDLLYALDESKRCAAERRVGSVIAAALQERRPVIVVAYSLGSLVSYGWLREQARDSVGRAPLRLITVGSPLGVQFIREVLYGDRRGAQALVVPSIVSAWDNVYDPNDALSAPLGAILSRVTDRQTHATEREDAHNFDRYLRDPATGAALKRAICEVTGRQTQGCERP